MNKKPEIKIDKNELEYQYTRSSGAGGQNVNKVSSKVVLRWNVISSTSIPASVKARFLKKWATRITSDGDIIVTSELTRDQARNKEDALAKLNEMISIVRLPPKRRIKTKPTRSSKERRLKEKKVRSTNKENRKKVDW